MKLYIVLFVILSVHYCIGQKDLPRLVNISLEKVFGKEEKGKFLSPSSYGGNYKVYDRNGMVGSTNIKVGKNEDRRPCPGDFICDKNFEGQDKQVYFFHEGGSLIGISEDWNAQPRIPKKLNEKDPKYAKIIREWAESRDMRHLNKFDVHYVCEVDLDNDGKQDIIISAGNMSMTTYTNGEDYFNGIFVYKNDVLFEVNVFYVTQKEAEHCTIENIASEGCRGNLYRYSTCLDVDGDGKMEIIADCTFAYGGFEGMVYRWKGNRFEKVLQAICAY